MKVTGYINKVFRKALGIEIKRARRPPHIKPRSLSSLNIDEYCKELLRAFHSSTKDKGFLLDRPTPLLVKLAKKTYINALRIELPTKEFLNLHSISFLDTSGSPVQVGRFASVITSSNYTNSDNATDYKNFLNPSHNSTYSIHTGQDDNPWIMVTFTKPVAIGSVLIKNRQDQNARRAVGLVLSIFDHQHKWQTVFELGGLSNYLLLADGIADKYKISQFTDGELVHRFMTSVIQGKNQLAIQIYKRLQDSSKKILRASVNKIVLRDRELEWTSHGPYRSFRFWSKKEKQTYANFASETVSELRTLTPDVCFGFGSVLAVVRDGDMIPHDDDMDIIVGFKQSQASSLQSALELVRSHLEQRGYSVLGSFFSHCHVTKGGVKKIDIFVGIYEDNDRIGWYPGVRKALHRNEVFPADYVPFLGRKCAIPAKAERYLEVTYGKNWRMPEPGWSHTWDNTSYRDIG